MAELVPLRAGDLAVDVAPHLGGSIVAFTRGSARILRETPPTALSEKKPTLAGSYPMIPFSNRIADARFAFGGESFELDRNFGTSPHAIHGNAWQRDWTVEDAQPSEALLSLDHDPAEAGRAREWPFAYRAEQRFVLTPDSLAVTIRLTNRDRRAMPAGFGLHPYFDRAGATLTFRAEAVWQSDDRLLPTRSTPVPEKWNCCSSKRIEDVAAVDHLFEGWGGTAEIAYPERGLVIRIAADPILSRLIVFRADERNFFAIEPATHMVDAINRMDSVADHGLTILEPGACLVGTVRFEIGTLR
ncbi:aldose 1-epimerase [Aurantimonas sp. VKM B-3413]|uniref:aldose 1-epimerase n=1 Tax=Aurantimonas sp. VKM B-3413 TaxID=2779401 RepID=UPI001E46BEBE|nr:aldose 1-epimerase [Aurantimonas sp. VKM B-3413]MCB8838801.1 aldose 1-epimerase [Aurantimonas sp. VKM B-3413]